MHYMMVCIHFSRQNEDQAVVTVLRHGMNGEGARLVNHEELVILKNHFWL